MIKEFKPSAAGKWGLPGGKLEKGESIVSGLRREVQEETGHKVLSEKLIGVINKPKSSENNTVIKFVFRCEVGNKPTTTAEHEYDFLTLPALEKLNSQGLIRGLEIVPLLNKIASGFEPDYSDLIQLH